MNTSTWDFSTIGLLGLGTMGAGVAQVLAASGRHVRVLEVDETRAAAGTSSLETFLDGGVERGKVSPQQRSEILARVTVTTRVDDLAGVDLVIESIVEDLAAKVEVLTRVADVVGTEVPIVTNTSALSVTEIAATLPAPERVAGLHFFNPAPVMRAIEVVRALQTDAALIERLVALVDTLDDKVAIPVDDRPGFLVNALLFPYLNDVIQELDDELATAEDLDVALKLGLGYRSGPMEMLDMVGLDVHLHGTEAAYRATGDTRYAPPPLLRAMVAAGRLGAKSGSGFRIHDTPKGH
ncbi:MAG: 3-hydroxyacyl-CoA dehydrogenase family protein [Aeromicrobium sp.]|uniref:3-hydroxyacyl-CoA dehydrogenase family protein n=1 Tax=Aeromicrobium sp. TaxID=1871063 RepID=UPI002629E552|nr:3-hydroxyacyl-CoA dehydrogenase family protein [Aeromicrobium sp.]MDF1704908.1 3-hydroxyacyl-CoA dehydrogenase family protein [Aeromicrobium sp.]